MKLRRGFLYFLDKLGLDTTNLKTTIELEGKMLDKGQKEQILFPDRFDDTLNWAIKKWNFAIGDTIYPGDVICIIHSKKIVLDFEVIVGGKLEYAYPVEQKLSTYTKIAVVTGH